MKPTALIFLGLALNAAVAFADDVHLKITGIYGETSVPGGELATNNIYVLLLPLHYEARVGGAATNTVYINPVVLNKFDADEIGKIIKGAVLNRFLPKESILHIDPDPTRALPPKEQIQALQDYCKKIGITVVVSATG